jgi:hypothetical protein
MQSRSISELQKELKTISQKDLVDISVRFAKYKKENKELLTYLLFEASDEELFIQKVKEEVDNQFTEINTNNLYYVKKSFRKILRLLNRNIKFSVIKSTELELRIYFLKKIKESHIAYRKNKVLVNLYENQLKKIDIILSKLHEDLQIDFFNDVNDLRST